ncbi:hypothetical protein SAMN02745225_00589 [Ferrithrix thermotolerans DSM 19514]|jgi:hypothetical protein|uniref:Regulator of chromosome condensation (RCC1) repeat-containing protein n=1 Tax=Ferrithrix thermotolerans DSM 19514 TaxID=1121881 RepID=A0A1M4TEZ7_9ACTN|nr:hypothetical protein [Ferrithrix thermotolerans]SHE43119.1 hypothetical protein SAMN02745225_00589 [Ferrithrix thermotolerans DSM 19514]
MTTLRPSRIVKSFKNAGSGYSVLFANGDLYRFNQQGFWRVKGFRSRSVPVSMTLLRDDEMGHSSRLCVLFADGTVASLTGDRWVVEAELMPRDGNPFVSMTGVRRSDLAVVCKDGVILDLADRVLAETLEPHSTPAAVLMTHPDSSGFYVVGTSGWVEAINDDLPYFGSLARERLNAPIVDGAVTAGGDGYWLLGADGGVFTFGAARFHGSLSGRISVHDARSILPLKDGSGYWILARNGKVYAMGNCAYLGSCLHHPCGALAVSLV